MKRYKPTLIDKFVIANEWLAYKISNTWLAKTFEKLFFERGIRLLFLMTAPRIAEICMRLFSGTLGVVLLVLMFIFTGNHSPGILVTYFLQPLALFVISYVLLAPAVHGIPYIAPNVDKKNRNKK